MDISFIKVQIAQHAPFVKRHENLKTAFCHCSLSQQEEPWKITALPL